MAYISFQPSGSFNATLYSGTGASNAVTGVGFAPDLVWVKNRAATTNQVLFDTVRGTTKSWYANEQDIEVTNVNGLTAFGADGFTMGSWVQPNTSGNNYASWNWNMGTTTGIAGSPSTTPTGYSFSAAAGQSIIYYIGTSIAGGGPIATLPHGLGKAPEFMMVKNLTQGARDNSVYHHSIGNTKKFYLNGNNAEVTSSSTWNDTTPGAVLFTVGGNEATNETGKYFVAYCFTGIKGYSKFESYIGNGNVDGPFVYTGFRPAMIIRKRTTTTGDWYITDNKRLGYNANNAYLFANTTQAESDLTRIDFLSNGFKIRTTDSGDNASGEEYCYAAFAEFPLVSSNDVPTTAR